MSSCGSVQSQPEPRYSLTAVDPVAGLGPLAVSVLVEGTGVRGRGFYFKTVGQAGQHQVVLQDIQSIETTDHTQKKLFIFS